MIAKIVIEELNKSFDYIVPSDVKAGMRLFVPFGKSGRRTLGIVTEVADNDFESRDYQLKEISQIIDKSPLITEELLELAEFIKNHCFCSHFQALNAIIPKEKKEKIAKWVKLIKEEENLSPNQKIIIEMLKNVGQIKLAELVAASSSLRSAASSLAKKGIIEIFDAENPKQAFNADDYKSTKPLELTLEQQAALNAILSSNGKFLLHGITGSGKTEVFLQAIAEIIKKGKQAIVLVPEISLTPQAMERFIGRFGNRISVLHSSLSSSEKLYEWKRILKGEVDIAIGARSAIFAPFKNLGLIIIDEEHESAYKSDSAPKYKAHEIASWRADKNNAKLILASATPSMSTFYRAQMGDYKILTLKKRATNALLPEVEVVDMRLQLAMSNKSMFSKELENEINERLAKKEQTILFLNRRGYNVFVSCRSCGDAIKCPNCSVTLTYHKYLNRLICHYCDYSMPMVESCPGCKSPYIRHFGDGTQKLEEEIKAKFPSATTLRMDADTTRTKGSHQTILDKFKNDKIDILIGTQMVTKGLDFANVTLVGVMSADLQLNMNDFRAFERTFCQLTQVCGRAGRGQSAGKAILQTYQPEHFVIELAKHHDYINFYKKEITTRKSFNNPPFCDILMFTAVGDNESILESSLVEAIRMLGGKMQIVPPSPAPISKIKGLARWRTLIKCNADYLLRVKIAKILEHFKNNKALIFSADINPNSMF